MPQERLSMRKIRDVLRYRHSAGLSLDAIARALNLSKGVVAKYIRLASAAGLGWPLPDELDDSGLEKLLYRQGAAREPTYADPDYAEVHQELKKKGVTLTLLWEEYLQAVGGRGYQYTAFCTRYKDWTGQLKRSMRQIHRAGEKLFADYAGPTATDHRRDHRRELPGQHLRRRTGRFKLYLCLCHTGANPRPTGSPA
jgi:transposase